MASSALTTPTTASEHASPAASGVRQGLPVTLDQATIRVQAGGAVRKQAKTILDSASVHIAPGQFVGILGSSGSGKSTLIKSIAGLMGLTDGRVLIDGEPQTRQSLQKDHRIAYLPQEVVIHEALTPRRALRYIARLKGLASQPGGIKAAVERVAQRTGMADRMDVPIHRLSGGQQKRVALAAELLGDPKVILLDEATSGLDPASEAEMMRLFRSLADEGRTVICITHFPDRLALCDKLIYLMHGKVVFTGAPEELQRFFDVDHIEAVYLAQSAMEAPQWRQRFDQTPQGQTHAIVQQAGLALPARPASAAHGAASGGLGQFLTLTRRYLRLQLADWQNLLLLFLQAPVIGLMIGLTYGVIRADFAEIHAADTKEVTFLLVLAMLWCSGMAAVRELVKEQVVFRHESRFGLKVLPYLFSKVSLLSVVAVAQAAVLLLIVQRSTQLTGELPTQLSVLVLTAAAGLALGLLVSAVAGSSERAMTILPVLLIMQAIFSGGMARPEGAVRVFCWIFVPAYWALDGLRATLDTTLTHATYPNAPGHFQPPILGTGGPLWMDLLLLVGHAGVFLAITYWFLVRQKGGGAS